MNRLKIFSKSFTKIIVFICFCLYSLIIALYSFSQEINPQKVKAEAKLNEGIKLCQMGEYIKAIVILSQVELITKNEKKLSDIYFYLSLSYFALEDIVSSKEFIIKILHIFPSKEISILFYPVKYVEMFNKIKSDINNEKKLMEPVSKLAKVDHKFNKKIKVIIDKVNIRLMPDLKSQSIQQVYLEEIIDSTGKIGEWYQIVLSPNEDGIKISGYINQRFIEDIGKKNNKDLKVEEENVLIHLKNGTVLKAKILSQNDQEIFIETSLAQLSQK